MSLVIAVANQKGGVGKTTTAVNLAVSLASAEHRTLLIDLDPQANATSALGVEDYQIPDIYDLIVRSAEQNDPPRIETISPHELPWLSLIPGSIDMAALETELADHPDRLLLIRRVLDGLFHVEQSDSRIRDHFEYIVIDTPPGIGVLSINALAASTLLIIPVQAEYLALEGFSQMLETVERVRESINPNLASIRVVTTMYDARLKLSRAVAEELDSKIKAQSEIGIYKTIIPRNVRLAEAPSFGQPILLFDPASSGALAYTELSKEVIEDGKTSTRSRTGLASAPQERTQN